MSNTELIRVACFPSEWEANVVVSLLETEGIRATANGGFTAGFRAEAPGSVCVLVNAVDQSAADNVVQDYLHVKKSRAAQSDSQSESQTGDAIAGRDLAMQTVFPRISSQSLGLLLMFSFVLGLLAPIAFRANPIVCVVIVVVCLLASVRTHQVLRSKT